MKKLYYFVFLSILASCQKEGDPLTLDRVKELNSFKVIPFEASINGSRFSGEGVTAIRLNKEMSLRAEINGQSYVVSTAQLQEGLYLGAENSAKNIISFTNENGVTFSSTKEGEISDAVINIEHYDVRRKLVSGIMNGTLYAPWDESVRLDNGKFDEVLVETPMLGNMQTTIDTELFESELCVLGKDTINGIIFNTFSSSDNCDTLSINFRIEGEITPRSYTIDNQRVTVTYNSDVFSSDVFRNQYTSDSGTLTISTVDNNTIRGTFNLKATNFIGRQVDLTNGSFTAVAGQN